MIPHIVLYFSCLNIQQKMILVQTQKVIIYYSYYDQCQRAQPQIKQTRNFASFTFLTVLAVMGSRNCHLMMVMVASCRHLLETLGHLDRSIMRTSM